MEKMKNQKTCFKCGSNFKFIEGFRLIECVCEMTERDYIRYCSLL